MNDYQTIINSLIAHYDIKSDTGRKKAYNACYEYAEKELDDSIDFNYFMKLAGKQTSQAPVMRNPLRLVHSDGTEKVHLEYNNESGPCLTANTSGLAYLAKALALLSESKLRGDHIHFNYREFPLAEQSYPLTVYYEEDEWFRDQVQNETADQQTLEENPENQIDPKQIKAFMITGQIPPDLFLTPYVIYPVRTVEKLEDQDTWSKTIKEDGRKMYCFEFLNDEGAITSLGLDLDDREVIFFTAEHLIHIEGTV